MGLIHVKRIEQKVLEIYNGIIDMSDYNGKPEEEKLKALKSRSIAAYAIFMHTGASAQTCANAVTDGYQDMGIDAVYNDVETKELYFVQSKWMHDGHGSPTQGEILKFIAGFKRALNLDFIDTNSKISSKSPDIEAALMDSDYKLHLLIVYTGNQKLSPEVKRVIDQLMNDMNDTSDVVQYTEISQKNLYDFISSGADASPIVIDDIDLREWGKMPEPYITFYGYISAETIAQWWIEYGNRLLAKNIRFFKGSSDANEGMVKTLNESPVDFWYYNNGIKVLCDSFSKKPIYGDDRSVGLFTAKGVSIVNGAQTVGCIGNVYLTNPDKVRYAKVFVQFISLEGTPQDYDIQVTRLSNTQNRIEGRDFAALDPEQERICRDLWMDGITYIYKGVTKDKNSENEITIDEATVALACYSSDIKLATLAKRNFGSFFENINKAPYTTLFNENTSPILLINTVKEVRYIDNLLTEKKKSLPEKSKKQIAVHGNRFLTHIVMQLQSLRSELYKPQNEILEQDINLIFDNLIDLTLSGIEMLYPDNYLNSLFKNNIKCSELEKYINEHWNKVSVK